jgi:predicted 3-demethylubiquinone-9 3-methyltransferase (glyoxalase superfamily)
MDNSIYPCLWFDAVAKNAMETYASVFPNSHIISENPMVTMASLNGQMFMGLNGGPIFQKNASISFMVNFDSEPEVIQYWDALLPQATVLMPLDTYPWSTKYGWLQDRFGVNWQFYLSKDGNYKQKISPTLMFAQLQQGKAAEAIHFYSKVFTNSAIEGILKYPEGPMQGQVQHSNFVINNYVMMAMDSGVPQTFSFNEGVSLVIRCKDQAEIDYYWNAFTEKGAESQCGWCKDPYGVSWQIIPEQLETLMSDPERAPRVMTALLKMKKIDLAALEQA